VVRFMDYCRERGIELPDRNFTIEYESSIPQRLGMGGSSAIIMASLRALAEYYGVEIPLPVQANLALETETRELGVPAGLQDRVVQAYEGLVYMDFSRELMQSRGYGHYELLDPALLPNVYVAYRTSLSEGTEVFHNNVRERWTRGDAVVMDAMRTWAEYAERGRQALVERDHATLETLINAGFDLRARIYKISEGNLEMVQAARSVGATSTFAGSGGAIAGTYRDEAMYADLVQAMNKVGVAVIRPQVAARRTAPPATAP
jgi:glucuronokinase